MLESLLLYLAREWLIRAGTRAGSGNYSARYLFRIRQCLELHAVAPPAVTHPRFPQPCSPLLLRLELQQKVFHLQGT